MTSTVYGFDTDGLIYQGNETATSTLFFGSRVDTTFNYTPTDMFGVVNAIWQIKYYNVTGTYTQNVTLNDNCVNKNAYDDISTLILFYDSITPTTQWRSLKVYCYGDDSLYLVKNIGMFNLTSFTPNIPGQLANMYDDNWSSSAVCIPGTFECYLNVTNDNLSRFYEGGMYFNVSVPELDNCTTYNINSLNFSLLNKTSNLPMPGKISGYFSYNRGNNDDSDYWQNKNYNLSWDSSDSNYSICIKNSVQQGELTGQIEYSTVGDTQTRLYYINDLAIDNSTQNIDLYFTDDTSQVIINVIDNNGYDLVGAYVYVREYDIGTDTTTTVEVLKTDSSGDVFANLELNNQRYSFLVIYDGVTVLASEPTIIVLTSFNLIVTLGSDYFSDFQTVLNTNGAVTFDNTTKLFTYTYTTPGTSNRGCLKVIKRTIYGDTEISNNCTTSVSATLTVSISDQTFDSTYIGTGTVFVDSVEYLVDTETVSFNYDYKTWGTEGLFITFLLVLSLAMIGVSTKSPAVTIVLVLIGVLLSIVTKLFYVSWGTIIVLVVIGGISIFIVAKRN